ncbi:MAG: T9SS type A sorting domain-containing protein [bacterium]|nr:T9SS type A sorting domain-containing protein [bacterium]
MQLSGSSQTTWTVLSTPSPDSSGCLMLQLSDGSILCKSSYGGGDRIGNMWNKLSPDINGSYINGTWSRACPMKDTRLYFSSQILKSGKIYVAGGEYGSGGGFGEIYDPLSNSWTQLPATNNYLGDACSAILPDGRILQASLSSFNKTLLFNPTSGLFSNGPNTLGGHNESTWLKLADGSILFVDIFSTNSERYIPSLNQWVADAAVPTNLYDPWGYETGPGFLLPDGRAIFLGSLGNTAIYTPSGNNSPGSWITGPNIPNNHGLPDAAGAMMVDGKIIFSAGPKPTSSSSIFVAPTYYYEFDYSNNSFTPLGAPGGGTFLADTAFNGVMLNLPDGTVMLSRQGSKNYFVHKPNGAPLAIGKPTITTVTQNGCTPTCTLTGLLFNGICEGACYGDDWQMNTNFPLVRLSIGSSVYYARSYNWNRTGVRTGLLPDTTLFDLPANLPNGTYSLCVIANGNSSDPIPFTFAPFPALTSALSAPDQCSGTNFSYSAAANMSNTSVIWTRAAVAGISNAAITVPQTSNPNETLINTGSISKTAVYSYTLSNGACLGKYFVSVVVHPVSTLTITGNTIICENASTVLNAKGAITYSWNTGASTSSVSLSPTATAAYSVSGLNYNSCLASQQVTVFVKPAPAMSILGSTFVCRGEATTLNVVGNGTAYLWSTGNVGNSIIVSPTVNTTYTATMVGLNGCSAKAVASVSVQTCDKISFFEARSSGIRISPNPFEDELTIQFTVVDDGKYDLLIIDVLGRVAVESTISLIAGPNNRMYNLKDNPPGIYVVVLRSGSNVFQSKVIKQ